MAAARHDLVFATAWAVAVRQPGQPSVPNGTRTHPPGEPAFTGSHASAHSRPNAASDRPVRRGLRAKSDGAGGGGLECGYYRGRHEVFLHTADASDRFRRDPQRLPLFVRLILGDPEMNNTVADNSVLRPDLRPLLTAELGEETGADGAVVAVTLWRRCTLCRPNRAHNVCPADDPDNLAFSDDRY